MYGPLHPPDHLTVACESSGIKLPLVRGALPPSPDAASETLPQWQLQLLEEVYEANGGQMSLQQYTRIATALHACNQKRPEGGCNMLVWGVGRDSQMWHTLNSGRTNSSAQQGHTVFLEDNVQWKEMITAQHPNLDVRLVYYKVFY